MTSLRDDATALAVVTGLLGPEPRPSGTGTAAAGAGDAPPAPVPTRAYVVLPGPRRPRYLIPVGRRHARGARIRPAARPARELVNRLVVRPALAAGAGRLLPGAIAVAEGPGPSLRQHLADLLDRPDVDIAVALGGPRPNRKPVVQVIGADGSTVAWAKLGVDGHTDALVAHEAEALVAHRPAAPVVAPEVVASGTWQGHGLLVLRDLGVEEAGGELPLTAEAVRAIARPGPAEPVGASAWWSGLRARAAAPGVDPHGAVARLLERVGREVGDATWPFGRWHGDLAPWNATWAGDHLVAWDWERSTGPVPVGLDAVHNRFQPAVLRSAGGGPVDVVAAAVAAATGEAVLLAALGHGSDDLPRLARAYLAELRVRYAEDARLGPLGPGESIAAAIDSL